MIFFSKIQSFGRKRLYLQKLPFYTHLTRAFLIFLLSNCLVKVQTFLRKPLFWLKKGILSKHLYPKLHSYWDIIWNYRWSWPYYRWFFVPGQLWASDGLRPVIVSPWHFFYWSIDDSAIVSGGILILETGRLTFLQLILHLFELRKFTTFRVQESLTAHFPENFK